tara:strand:+ start:152 stop:901 length:750 start_codon:yes stop_codon:yes gene_type:complete
VDVQWKKEKNKMAKQNLNERFQELAGIKPLYEQSTGGLTCYACQGTTMINAQLNSSNAVGQCSPQPSASAGIFYYDDQNNTMLNPCNGYIAPGQLMMWETCDGNTTSNEPYCIDPSLGSIGSEFQLQDTQNNFVVKVTHDLGGCGDPAAQLPANIGETLSGVAFTTSPGTCTTPPPPPPTEEDPCAEFNTWGRREQRDFCEGCMRDSSEPGCECCQDLRENKYKNLYRIIEGEINRLKFHKDNFKRKKK